MTLLVLHLGDRDGRTLIPSKYWVCPCNWITCLEGFCFHLCNMSNTKMSTFPNSEKRVENTPCSGVILTNFDVFQNLVKYGLG